MREAWEGSWGVGLPCLSMQGVFWGIVEISVLLAHSSIMSNLEFIP